MRPHGMACDINVPPQQPRHCEQGPAIQKPPSERSDQTSTSNQPNTRPTFMKVLVTGAAGFIGMHVYTAGRAIDRLPGPQHTSLRRAQTCFPGRQQSPRPQTMDANQEMRYQIPEVNERHQTALMHAQTFVPNQTMQAGRLAATRRAW